MPDVEVVDSLQRKLTTRMLTMITIGGSIGTGIFLASGNAIYLAGPGGTMLAYLITGVMAYFLICCLGEMAAYMPNTGSFYSYASQFVDPALGYALGWNYWYSWAVTVASEMSATAIVMQYWLPNSPAFIWCAGFLAIVVGFNAFSANMFGVAEYIFSFIKITVIVLFIVAGFAIVFGVMQDEPVGFRNWQVCDGPFHGGLSTLFPALMIAGFSFQGSEIIGIVAGESANPGKDVPRAIAQVFWRILLFFILAIFVITLLIPHTSAQLSGSSIFLSPFTLVFKQYHLGFVISIMNAVVLVAIISTGNSGMYAGARILWYLATNRHIPKFFSRVNKRGVPIYALAATASVSLLAFITSLYSGGIIYFWLLNAASLSGFIVWFGIAVSHYRFRKAYLQQGKELKNLPYIAKGFPYSTLFILSCCLLIVFGQNIQLILNGYVNWYDLLVSYVGLLLFISTWVGYKLFHRTRLVDLKECSFGVFSGGNV